MTMPMYLRCAGGSPHHCKHTPDEQRHTRLSTELASSWAMNEAGERDASAQVRRNCHIARPDCGCHARYVESGIWGV
jgi:hypothetical protein